MYRVPPQRSIGKRRRDVYDDGGGAHRQEGSREVVTGPAGDGGHTLDAGQVLAAACFSSEMWIRHGGNFRGSENICSGRRVTNEGL